MSPHDVYHWLNHPTYQEPDLPPVRLCCGQRHYGVQCPDGKVMCCLCFGRYDLDGLSVCQDTGQKQDLCLDCDRRERAALAAIKQREGGSQ